ncbi:MAG: DUF3375 domain-containing protein [Microbacterium sp.]
MELDDLDRLYQRHPAWRLLRARNAPLVLSFLGAHFVETGRGATPAGELILALDDHLYAIHRTDPERYPSDAADYLEDWASPESAWLRRFYPHDSDEVHYESTPALERAYRFAESLQTRAFVGTESRLGILVDLLRQMVHESQEDPQARIEELQRQRDEIDRQLDDARQGRFAVMGETALRERYQQFSTTARELLSDFREVEENLRGLDRSAREKIASWDGGKGELLADLVGSRTDISASDQGRSFQAFYDFLLSEGRQDELADLLDEVQLMPQIAADRRLRTVHHDWAEAAERTQQTVRNLSEQLRRFLEDQVWVENRRVLDLVRSVEAAAIGVREDPPKGTDIGLVVDEPGIVMSLPFERPLYDPQPEVRVDSAISPAEAAELELGSLLSQRYIDTARLADNIRAVVPPRSTARLDDIVALYPIEEGIAEVLGYLSLDGDEIGIEMGADEMALDYRDADGRAKSVRMPEVQVVRR